MLGLEPTLSRYGYDEQVWIEPFRINLSEMRPIMKGNLDSTGMLESTEEMREAGLPS
ncbi:MAG: phosphoribulokinase [Gammaproteobacteria bacterium]